MLKHKYLLLLFYYFIYKNVAPSIEIDYLEITNIHLNKSQKLIHHLNHTHFF